MSSDYYGSIAGEIADRGARDERPIKRWYYTWDCRSAVIEYDTVPGQPGQVPPGHPDAGKPVGWGEHPRDCDCGDCP